MKSLFTTEICIKKKRIVAQCLGSVPVKKSHTIVQQLYNVFASTENNMMLFSLFYVQDR